MGVGGCDPRLNGSSFRRCMEYTGSCILIYVVRLLVIMRISDGLLSLHERIQILLSLLQCPKRRHLVTEIIVIEAVHAPALPDLHAWLYAC